MGRKMLIVILISSLWFGVGMAAAVNCLPNTAALKYDGWQIAQGQFVRVFYQGNTAEILQEAQMIQRVADTYFPAIQGDFQWDRKEKLDFILFHDKAAMAKVLHMEIVEEKESSIMQQERRIKNKTLPMGAYYDNKILVLSPSLWTQASQDAMGLDEFLEKGPVVHEMVHFALDEKVAGTYPLWLTEGVALYYEKKYIGVEWRPDLEKECKDISMEDLEYRFRQLPAATAYRRAYELIANFVEKKGEQALQEYIEGM